VTAQVARSPVLGDVGHRCMAITSAPSGEPTVRIRQRPLEKEAPP
jgi:hypothetical protein